MFSLLSKDRELSQLTYEKLGEILSDKSHNLCKNKKFKFKFLIYNKKLLIK